MNKYTEYYADKFETYSVEFQNVSSKLKRFTWYRLLSFLAVIVSPVIFGWHWFVWLLMFAFVCLFFFLVKKNLKLDKQKQKLEVLKKLVEDEQKALKHSFLHFQDGKEFLNTQHFFSYDLDLFGRGSLFQFLNRTTTIGGRQKLATWLIKPSKSREEICQRQEAVKELSEIPDWRLEFRANGNLFNETEAQSKEIKSWSGMELGLNHPGRVKWLIRILPIITVLSVIPTFWGNYLFLVLFASVQFILMYFFWQRINQYFLFFGRKSELLSKYMQLLHILERRKFKSEYLVRLQNEVLNPSASNLFKQLKSLVKEFEYRQNILVGVALNGIFLWDIRCVYKLWEWHRNNHQKLAQWLDVIAETDVLVSLGNYAGNHPDFVFPEIVDSDFIYQASSLGHPLLKANKRICNDFEISGLSKVMIVTGANMAGKSTFLRTVGVNLILAETGAPVCADKMQLSPIDIYTNMRTTDSLLNDESYFFAELKRIKGVLDCLQNGERIFVILDEMLKGTNSVDKLNGSQELIRKLVELKAVSLIATHDLKLSEMETEYPDHVSNRCFEIRIENDELIFDYKLSEGVTRTMNATFLMRKMGII